MSTAPLICTVSAKYVSLAANTSSLCANLRITDPGNTVLPLVERRQIHQGQFHGLPPPAAIGGDRSDGVSDQLAQRQGETLRELLRPRARHPAAVVPPIQVQHTGMPVHAEF